MREWALSPDEYRRLVIEHSKEPQCQVCMQPQRCKIGRLLDTIKQASKYPLAYK